MMYVGRPVEAGKYTKGSKDLPKGVYMGGSCDVKMGEQPCWATVAHAHLPNKQIVVVPEGHWVVLREGQLLAVMGDAEFNQWYMPMETPPLMKLDVEKNTAEVVPEQTLKAIKRVQDMPTRSTRRPRK